MKTFKTYIIVFLFLTITVSYGNAQANVQGSGFVEFASGVNNLTYGVQEIKDNSKKIKGSSLLFDEYMKGTFKLKQGNISEVYLLNYDLFENTVNVTGKDVVFTVPVSFLDSMNVASNGIEREFRLFKNEKGESKLMEVLVDGEFTLLKDVRAKLINPTYKATIDTGDKFYKIRKKSTLYFLDEGSVIKLPNKSKKVKRIKALKSHVVKAEEKEKINFKKEDEVVTFFESINQTK